jgi:hypothetical protein
MRSIVLLALLVAAPVSAQQVIWKCRDARGALTFQNAPCEPGTREVGAKEYNTPDHYDAAQNAQRISREVDARNRALHRPVYSYSAPRAALRARPQATGMRGREG